MKVKKTVATIMGASVLMMSLPMAVGISMAATTQDFSDVSASNPNFTAIEYLKAHDVIGGYPDGTFKPDQVVNRAEALKIILLGSGVTVPASVDLEPFRDTDRAAWYAPYVQKAKDLNVVQGYADGSFKPAQTVNLVENLKILLLTQNVSLTSEMVMADPYADAMKDQWYAPYVQYAKEKGLIDADSKNMVYPAQGMTRGKLAETMYRLMYIKANDLDMYMPGGMTQQPTQEQTQQTQQTQQSQQSQQSTQQTQQSQQSTTSVNITNFQFSPSPLTIKAGTTVTWTNSDAVTHTVTSDDGTTFSSGNITNGQTFTFTFSTPGTYTYHCAIHPSMIGTVVVSA